MGLKVIWKKMQELQDKEATARLEANRLVSPAILHTGLQYFCSGKRTGD